jgi:hypothetical protein
MNAMPNEPTPIAGGGGPPYDAEMDRRLTVLETRFDTILPNLATKSDLESLRAEMRVEMERLRTEVAEKINDAMKWMIGLFITFFIGMLGVNFAMLNSLKSLIATGPAAVSQHADPASSKQDAPLPPAPVRPPQ